jgi:hypothetical protein
MTSDPEELFPPVRGGMVDTARQQAMAEHQQAERAIPLTREDPGEYAAIRVRDDAPDLGVARTYVLSSTQPFAQILPRDDTRRSAIIVAVDNAVWWGFTEGPVQDLSDVSSGGGNAFYLPAGTCIPILSKAPVWVSPTTTGSVSRVSVAIFRDSS